MRVLLCLLSDQHVPNLLSVHHYKPDQLVLVESTAMKKKGVSRNFLNALKIGGLDYENRKHIEPLDTEDDLAAVRKALKAAYGCFPSGEWIANATGGTKPMSIATHEFFKALSGKIVYTNVSRPAQIMDMGDCTAETCNHKLTIKEFLAGYGFESRKSDEDIARAENRARDWAESAALLAQHASELDILQFDDKERNKARDKGIELGNDRFTFPCDRLRDIWLANAPSRKLDHYEAEFLTGGWLEVFVWNLLHKFQKELEIWDVRLGIQVAKQDANEPNELDVSFVRNQTLTFAECKSGSQSHDKSGEVFHKTEAIKKLFGASRTESFLVSTGSNLLDSSGNVKKHFQTRAANYRCPVITAKEIREIASSDTQLELIQKYMFGSRV